MRKSLLFLWTLCLAGIVAYVVWESLRDRTTEADNTGFFKSNVFDACKFRELLTANDHVLLTIGAEECNLCDVILSDRKLLRYPICRYYICKDTDSSNLLVAQALRTGGFPTSCVFDSKGSILGSIAGLKDFTDRMDKVVRHGSDRHKSDDGDRFEMVGYAFDALLAYFEHDYVKVYGNALRSKSFGDYFFNNYLLYKCKQNDGEQDSVAYYKDAALRSLEDVDIFIFESLIGEIDPDNEALSEIEQQRATPHTHDHSHH